MASSIAFTIIDNSDEYSAVKLNISDVDDSTWVAVDAKIATLQAAVAALTTGNIAYKTLTAYRKHVDDSRPANPYAQRESGLRLFVKDTVTGKKTHLTIPAPDMVIVGAGGSDEIDLTLSLVAPVVAAIEALMVSEAGNPVKIYKGIHVGRRN